MQIKLLGLFIEMGVDLKVGLVKGFKVMEGNVYFLNAN